MRRVPEFDALRGLAATAVLLFHISPPRFFFGWAGVDLFFVLSGYLITTIIVRHAKATGFIYRFYARRSLRIWPIYYLALAGLVVANPLLPRPEPMAGLPYYLTYLQNLPLYWTDRAPPFQPAFGHTWTLALEEQFYLLWPALVLWAGRPRLVRLCLATIAVAVAARHGGPLWSPFSERLLLARCDAFALGGLLAALLADGAHPMWSARRLRGLFATASLGALAYLAFGIHRYGNGWLGLPTPAWPATTILAIGLLFFGVVGLVACLAGHPALAPLRFGPLVYLGKISYGLYLYHYILYWIIDGFAFKYDQSARMSALKIGASVATAAVSWALIERPILALKEWFRYEGRAAQSPPKEDESPVPGPRV